MSELYPSSDAAGTQVPDLELHLAYAEASVMLVECLMLVLMEKKVLPLESLMQSVEAAIEAKRGLIKDGAHPQIAILAAGVLSKIANSLSATQQENRPRS